MLFRVIFCAFLCCVCVSCARASSFAHLLAWKHKCPLSQLARSGRSVRLSFLARSSGPNSRRHRSVRLGLISLVSPASCLAAALTLCCARCCLALGCGAICRAHLFAVRCVVCHSFCCCSFALFLVSSRVRASFRPLHQALHQGLRTVDRAPSSLSELRLIRLRAAPLLL